MQKFMAFFRALIGPISQRKRKKTFSSHIYKLEKVTMDGAAQLEDPPPLFIVTKNSL